MAMPWGDVLWTDENEAHLLAHKVSRREAEHVLRNAIAYDVSESSGRPIVFGYTSAGRKIAIVYEVVDSISVYPITAYDVE
jgi:uncharacterized DUF497 family protein